MHQQVYLLRLRKYSILSKLDIVLLVFAMLSPTLQAVAHIPLELEAVITRVFTTS